MNEKLQRKLALAVLIFGFIATFIGFIGAMAWILDINDLKVIHPLWVVVKFNTGLAVFLLGVATLLSGIKPEASYYKPLNRFRKFFSLFASSIGFLTFLEYLTGLDFNIDQLFFLDHTLQRAGIFAPGRMAFNTSLAIGCIGLALYLINYETHNGKRPSQYLAGIGYILVLPALTLYFYKISFDFGIAPYIQMAFPTTIALFCVCTAILSARPNKGFMAFVFAKTPAGLMLQSLIPAAVIIPLAFGLITLTGARLKFYDTNFGLTMTVLMCILVWGGILVSTAKQLMAVDQERQEAEFEKNKLAEQNEADSKLFQTVLETMPSALIVGEAPSGRLIYANSHMAKVWREPHFKTTASNINQKRQGFFPDGKPYDEKDWPLTRSIQKGEFIFGEEIEIVRVDGTRGVIRSSSAPIFDKAGKITAAVVICEDITDLKVAEEQRIHLLAEQRNANSVRDSEIRLRSIFDSAFEAIVTNNSKGEITEWNPRAEKMFSIKREEALGRKVYDLIIPPKLREGHIKATEKFYETGYGPLLNKTIEIEAIRKNGEIFPIQLSVSVTKQKNEFVFTSFIDDITERKKNERDLIAAKQAALDAASAKAEFLANMSHEIRTPLNGVVGLADLLNETPVTNEQKKLIGLIQDSGNHLLKVINDILDFSKIEAGRLIFESIEFNIKSLLVNTSELFKYKLLEKKIELEVNVDSQIPPYLLGDPGRLGQVLINLLSNAVKFTEKGKIRIDARLENNDLQKPKIRIRVQDTGIGLSEDGIKKLFNPFVQADGSTARKYGGTGLGLSICKRLVEQMQGEIGVESKEGVGSIFWFTAVFEAADRSLSRFKNENSQIEFQIIPDANSFKILVAEDNSTNQLLTLSQLKSLGYTAQAVANGIEAVSAFRTNNFDLILMDCQMPEMDGFDATKEIRKLEMGTHSRIPIVALTANAMKEDEVKCKEVGMDDYLSKPTKKEKLGSIISKWLISSSHKKAS